MQQTKVSIIIPTRKYSSCLENDLIPALDKQTYKQFEIIIIIDKQKYKQKFKLSTRIKIIEVSNMGPAGKRNIGVKSAKGNLLAFIDDDAYPEEFWLENALLILKQKNTAAVCGPGITPPQDDFKQKISGWVWSSWIGAGGAGTYRSLPQKRRYVDDFPSFNLIIKRKDFDAVGGFNANFWPGEDTKLCHDLVYKLHKKIIYDPKVFVYHHRRPIIWEHLKQLSRYGLHRGYFVKAVPKTSKRIAYFLPLLFVIWLLGFFILLIHFGFWHKEELVKQIVVINSYVLLIYFLVLLINSVWVMSKSRSMIISLLLPPTIFLSHLAYGIMFGKGLLIKKLSH